MLRRFALSAPWRPTLHYDCRQPICQALVSEDSACSLEPRSADVFQVSSSASGAVLRGGAGFPTESAQSHSSSAGSEFSASAQESGSASDFKDRVCEGGPKFHVSFQQDPSPLIQARQPEAGHESRPEATAPSFKGCGGGRGTVDSRGSGVKLEGPKVSSEGRAKEVISPGSRAPRVFPSDLWSKFFETLSRSDCSLSSFFHSIRLLPCGERGPSQRSRCQQSGQVWPIPLPFPKLLKPGSPKVRDPVELGLNAVVLILDWLFLGQPPVIARGHRMSLGEPLSSIQSKALCSLRQGIEDWNQSGPFGPEELGRSAPKFESLYDMLHACQEEYGRFPPGADLEEAVFSFSLPCHVLPVEPDRLNFVGRPSFDPRPYLDTANRQTYEDPLRFAEPLTEETRLPHVAVQANKDQARRLLKLLDSSGRLELFAREEVRPGVRSGLFSVPKDGQRDRMVLDARPPNALESSESRWIKSLGTLEQIQFMHLPDDCDLEVHAEDLREFYHSFIVSPIRAARNVLALEFSYEDVAHLSVCSKSMRNQVLIPALRTMAMGDTNAVAYGQTSHLAVLLQTTSLRLSDFLCLRGRPPRSRCVVAGLLIDDFVLLDPVPKVPPSPDYEPRGVRIMREVVEGYRASGLPRHEGKAVSRASVGDFWGGQLDGKTGILRPSPKRVSGLAAFLLEVVRGGVTSVGMLEVITGSLVSGLQLRRRLLSLLDEVYAVQQHRPRNAFIRVRGNLCNELLTAAALLCQVDVDIRAPGAPLVLTTDASSTAEAGAVAEIPSDLSIELSRHGLQRGLWSRLLSPAQAFLQERGELEECQALPGEAYTSHPLWEEVCCALQFRQFGKIVQVGRRRHINVGEVRAAIRGEEGVGRRYPGSRYIHLQDSQVSLATFVKGRSSSRAINFELRRSLPCYLANRVRPSFGFIRSKLNPSDDPTRSCELRRPSREPSDWFASSLEGNFGPLDVFLYEQELHPEQLAGLPDPRELSSDGPLAEVAPAKHRRARVTHDPEKRARQILRHESISSEDALEIFRRLPKEVSSRSSGLRGGEASFSAGVFVHGGVVGLRKNCELFPTAVQVLTGLLRSIRPGFVFSSLAVNQNIKTLPHFDRNNLSSEPNLVVALSRFRRGGIWIETLGGSVEVVHRNQVRVGEVLDVSSHPVLVDARRLHCTMGWRGSRIVLIGFTVRGTEKLSSAQRAEALSLGFVLPPEGGSGESTQVSEHLPQVPRVVRPPRSKPLHERGNDARRSHRPWRVDPFHFSVGSPGVEPAFTASYPQACSLDRVDPLPSSVLQMLRSMPPGRFVFSSAFPDLDSALCSGSGWLDLFSGMRGFARALAAAAPCWVLCLDVSHGEDEDLLDPDLQGSIFELVRGGAFAGIWPLRSAPRSRVLSFLLGGVVRTPKGNQG